MWQMHCQGTLLMCREFSCSSQCRTAVLSKLPHMCFSEGNRPEEASSLAVDICRWPFRDERCGCTHQGNQYAIVFVDHLTKWPEVLGVPDQKAETVAHLLVEHVVVRLGVPERLLSNRVPNFLSSLVQEVCKLLGTVKVNTSGYHPL